MNANRTTAAQHPRTGFALGLAAYALWGVLPLYFKALAGVRPFDIVAHRVLWSLPFLALLILLSRGWPKVRAAIARPRTVGILVATALLIGGTGCSTSML
jgi:chloramphenicol-sensitive protein RarD